ncbi:MAG: chromosome segregation protein SMC [Bradyrhizobium sp.]|uniref:chromosome segregation protein SMC n=1 Tax=Bradyrhizobium sp. TaxID=376 RepID=UPI0029B4664A|nr:chromosome segregation protein SMC [Bradyrhizobium sp.]MDX3966784.1 chromosome segregation protein SMC [Bradyrhizobium sp.]
MPQQPDLLGPQPLTVTPAAGLAGPRLWIRRLVIWKEPGGEKVRDVTLRPGLNIIWSPDGSDDATLAGQENAIGHGSGKTLFCRLIRYCLGEDRFATETQRDRIGTAFLNGIVGAEVMVDGTCWAIVRPLGVRRRHMAVANGNLDEIAAGEGTSTGLEPFIEAVDQNIITPALAELVRPRTDGPAWPVALAWLTRDQECRFDDVLDWRSPTSDSDSPIPASGREKGPRLEALRAFLMAITPEEQATRAQVTSLDEQRRTLDQEIGHRRWEIDRTQTRLVSALGLADQSLPEMPLLFDVMRKTAGERVAAATKLPAGGSAELVTAREEYEAARAEWVRLDGERIRIEASIPLEARVLSEIRGELPGLSFTKVEAESPVCPICEVPIDRALAEGCSLSHKLPDAAACRQRWAQRQTDFEQQTQKLQALGQERTDVLQQVALARQTVEQFSSRLAAIERARDAREATWYSARRLQDDVERMADLINAQDAATRRLRELATKLERERDRLGAFWDKQARVFGRMSEKFDPIVRRLVGHNAKGRIVLSGGRIELSVDMGGDRTTAAIDSLKVLAFDLAALCLSIEGATRVPAFLLHDSPREADLGLSIYHQLFHMVRELEKQAEQPLFQYIVTTTTRPSDDLTREPWLVLTVRGSPGHERLLGCDL